VSQLHTILALSRLLKQQQQQQQEARRIAAAAAVPELMCHQLLLQGRHHVQHTHKALVSRHNRYVICQDLRGFYVVNLNFEGSRVPMARAAKS
jgi:hypothetical protein